SGSPSAATWTQLTATVSNGHTSGYASTWTASGNISLNGISGTNVYIAFKYEGADPATGTKKTTTYEIDDVKVVGN
ncbi:MAG TPA: choice-of-anchor J domain-containing protein, partial [Chitinophagaceae bacterium]